MSVAVLFARADSIYKTMPGVDVWDAARDARHYAGPHPIVAHPPCRSWGCLRAMSKHTPEEKALAPWAVGQVRRWGGVLEHPRGSSLWKEASLALPRPGKAVDAFGGFTLYVEQVWWGHRASKATLLYVCGMSRTVVPAFPLHFGYASHVITNQHKLRAGDALFRPEVTKREREATPPRFAEWLVDLARRARPTL